MNYVLQAVLWNAVLAGGLALGVLAITRVWRNPHLAHALWLLVLVKLVTPPMWHAPWLDGLALAPPEKAEVMRAAHSGAPTNPDGDADEAGEALPPGGWPIDDASIEPLDATEPEKPTAPDLDALPSRHAEPAPAQRTVTTNWLALNWQQVISTVWAASVAVCVAWVVRRQWRFRAVTAGSAAAPEEWVQDAECFSRAVGLSRCPAVRVTEAHVPPLVSAAGWASVILLPRQLLAALDRDQRRAVLVHELAHLRRRDHWVRWFEVAVLCLFWWNPVAWWAAGRLRAAAEECCDAWVLWLLPRSRRSYGRALLRTVEFLTERDVVPGAVGAAFGGFPVKRRIEMIMQRELPRKMSWPVAMFLLLLAVLVLPLAAPAAVAGNNMTGDGAAIANDPAAFSPPAGLPDPAGSSAAPATGLPGGAQAAADENAGAPATSSSRGAADRKLEDRIERLERVVDDLVKALKADRVRTETGARPGSRSATAPTSPPIPGYPVAPPDHRLAKTVSDGKRIALLTPGTSTSEVVLFDGEGGKILWKSIIPGRADGFGKADDAGKQLAVRCGDTVHVLDLSTGKLLDEKAAGAGGKKPEPVVRIFRLKFSKASAVAEQMLKIFPTLTIAVDERANSVIAHGDDKALAKLEALLEALDTADEK